MVATDFRLKIRHWFRKYKKIIAVVLIVWGVVFVINRYLKDYTVEPVPNTTYTPSVSVIDSSKSAPSKVQTTAEKLIEEYVGYCNEGNYQKAFDMLSDDCKEYAFENDVEFFAEHVLKKMTTPKEYSIQNYSNYGDYYIYEIKYTDDILATGLTNQVYNYSTEKIVFKKDSKGAYEMSVGNFIEYDKIASVAENEYLKIDIKDRIVRYSIETYQVKFTNRTDSTIVISDGLENDEVNLVLYQEYRGLENANMEIVLRPGESETFSMTFSKFADDGEKSQGILFNSIRVIEDYKGKDGTEAEQQQEITNAIAKFSMQVPVD